MSRFKIFLHISTLSFFVNWLFCLLFFIMTLSLLGGCQERSSAAPDVSHIDTDLLIMRFEEDFPGKNDPSSSPLSLSALEKKYPAFFDVYFRNIIADRPLRSDEIGLLYQEVLDGQYLNDLLDIVSEKIPDLDGWILETEDMIRRYRYYLGDNRPKVLVTFLSEFGVGACTIGEDTLGIGLDMYLGSDFEGYDPVVFPSFIRSTMIPEYIPIHLAKVIAQNLIDIEQNNRMLDIMLYNGKVLYLMSLLLPDKAMHQLMEYTPEQMSWVQQNELQIWSHFLSNDLIYSTRKQDYQKLIGPSPNAPGMPPEAPGQTANWIGYQIIKAYMKRNPSTDIYTLLQYINAQDLLEKSRYRPS